MDATTPFLKMAGAQQRTGEQFVGVILEPQADGSTAAYGVFLLEGQIDRMNHKDARALAQELGADIPTRREMNLIAANASDRLDRLNWYWTIDGFQGGDRSYYCYDSKDGRISYSHNWYQFSALVVRRERIC